MADSTVAKAERDKALLARLAKTSEEEVEELDLSFGGHDWIPETIGSIPSLQRLNLCQNQLELLPECIGSLAELRELHLSSNLLTRLPDAIGLLYKLTALDVSSNRLTVLPDTIANLSSLETLNINFNNIQQLPTNLCRGLPHLRSLSVALNKLSYLPENLNLLSSLESLDAHFNRLKGLPASIGRLSALQQLNVSDNFSDLTSLPSSVGSLSSLKSLNVSNNQLKELPLELGRLTALERLNLEGNPWEQPLLELAERGEVDLVKAYLAEALLKREQEIAKLNGSWDRWLGGVIGEWQIFEWLTGLLTGAGMAPLLGIEGPSGGSTQIAQGTGHKGPTEVELLMAREAGERQVKVETRGGDKEERFSQVGYESEAVRV